MNAAVPAATTTTSGLAALKNASLLLTFEIGFLATGRNHIAPVRGETAHDRGADHATVTRHVNPLPREIKELNARNVAHRHS
jgi:hypothetical protein